MSALIPAVSEIVRLVEEGERKKNRPVENRDKVSSLRAKISLFFILSKVTPSLKMQETLELHSSHLWKVLAIYKVQFFVLAGNNV